jgi:hypothetical protein
MGFSGSGRLVFGVCCRGYLYPGVPWKGGATVQESEWAKGQKETRIIDTLEPVLTQHRMVVAESFLREDAATEDRNYAFLCRPGRQGHEG